MIEFENAKALHDWFGRWPTLHDAEVISVNFDRGSAGIGPSIGVTVHAFQMTSDIDNRGHFKFIKHCLVKFQFDGVNNNLLESFNGQNVIAGISLETAKRESGGDLIAVEFEPCYGVQLNFTCRTAKVVSVEPYVPKSGVYARDQNV